MKSVIFLISNFIFVYTKVIKKNIKYKNKHAGETCLIIGNGSSLKYYDFSKIKNLTTICCTYSLIDKRLKNLDVKYCIIPDSAILYSIRRDSYSGKIIKNLIGPILKKIIRENPCVDFFTPLTNMYSIFCRRFKNINYFYAFGEKYEKNHDLAGIFSTDDGALDVMIGTARYMGFTNLILIGCDYLCHPKLEGHFYAYLKPSCGVYDYTYVDRIKKITADLEMTVIVPDGFSCPSFKFKTYADYFGGKEQYQENTDFIDSHYLSMMHKASLSKQILI